MLPHLPDFLAEIESYILTTARLSVLRSDPRGRGTPPFTVFLTKRNGTVEYSTGETSVTPSAREIVTLHLLAPSTTTFLYADVEEVNPVTGRTFKEVRGWMTEADGKTFKARALADDLMRTGFGMSPGKEDPDLSYAKI